MLCFAEEKMEDPVMKTLAQVDTAVKWEGQDSKAGALSSPQGTGASVVFPSFPILPSLSSSSSSSLLPLFLFPMSSPSWGMKLSLLNKHRKFKKEWKYSWAVVETLLNVAFSRVLRESAKEVNSWIHGVSVVCTVCTWVYACLCKSFLL